MAGEKLKGTIVNVLAVLAGSGIGLIIGNRITEGIKRIIMQTLGLASLLIGVKMAIKGEDVLLIILALLGGGIVGELLDIEGRLEAMGEWLKRKARAKSASFVPGFVTASLVYCVGAMTIVGSIQEGITGNAEILYAKSILDGTASVAFAATLGVGVAFSALTVLSVQGSLTLLGSNIKFLMEEKVLNDLTAVGGLLIVGIGFYLLDIARVRVANMLPGLVLVVIFSLLF